MDNYYLCSEIARMQHQERLVQAEHERMLAANGLDLMSVIRRALVARLPRLRRRDVVRVAPRRSRLPASRFAPR